MTKTSDFRELEYRKEGEEGAVLASFLLHGYQCVTWWCHSLVLAVLKLIMFLVVLRGCFGETASHHCWESVPCSALVGADSTSGLSLQCVCLSRLFPRTGFSVTYGFYDTREEHSHTLCPESRLQNTAASLSFLHPELHSLSLAPCNSKGWSSWSIVSPWADDSCQALSESPWNLCHGARDEGRPHSFFPLGADGANNSWRPHSYKIGL